MTSQHPKLRMHGLMLTWMALAGAAAGVAPAVNEGSEPPSAEFESSRACAITICAEAYAGVTLSPCYRYSSAQINCPYTIRLYATGTASVAGLQNGVTPGWARWVDGYIDVCTPYRGGWYATEYCGAYYLDLESVTRTCTWTGLVAFANTCTVTVSAQGEYSFSATSGFCAYVRVNDAFVKAQAGTAVAGVTAEPAPMAWHHRLGVESQPYCT